MQTGQHGDRCTFSRPRIVLSNILQRARAITSGKSATPEGISGRPLFAQQWQHNRGIHISLSGSERSKLQFWSWDQIHVGCLRRARLQWFVGQLWCEVANSGAFVIVQGAVLYFS